MPKFERGTEIVDGIVLGEFETRSYYQFYSQKDGRLLLNAGRFESDRLAIENFESTFSVDPVLMDKYRYEGVEMRVFE
jgi:hypothetical protein